MVKTMKTYEAINLCKSLESLIRDKSRRLPGKAALAISRSYKRTKEILDEYDNFQRDKIISMLEEEKAEKINDEKGERVQVKDEFMDELIEYLNDIAFEDTDVEIQTMSESIFEKVLDSYELSFVEIEALEMLVREE